MKNLPEKMLHTDAFAIHGAPITCQYDWASERPDGTLIVFTSWNKSTDGTELGDARAVLPGIFPVVLYGEDWRAGKQPPAVRDRVKKQKTLLGRVARGTPGIVMIRHRDNPAVARGKFTNPAPWRILRVVERTDGSILAYVAHPEATPAQVRAFDGFFDPALEF